MILPLVCLVGIFNPVFDKRPMFYIGSVCVTYGVISMITLMLKGVLTISAAYRKDMCRFKASSFSENDCDGNPSDIQIHVASYV